MWKNYLKIAYRNLVRQKGYTFINIAGLAVGLAACLVIALFVRHELSYDRFHPNADRVYRLVRPSPDGEGGQPRVPPGLAQVVESRFPEVEHATEISWPRTTLIALGEERRYVDDVVTADEHFLEVFPFKLLRGNPETALARPNRLVFTRSLAERLFGEDDPMGQVVRVEEGADYTVTGIVENVPSNAHFSFQALRSLSEEQRAERYSSDVRWEFFGDFLYMVLHEGSTPEALEDKLMAYMKTTNLPEQAWDQMRLAVQPVTAIHLHSTLSGEIAPQSDVRYLYLFSAIGALILLIACVNYMNLATARSAGRAREVGMRKVVGAHRRQLIGQFLGEAVLMGLLAMLLAVALAHLAVPLVNRLTGQALEAGTATDGPGLLAMLGVVLVVSMGSGLYPALFLSRFRPVRVLHGHGSGKGGGRLLRQVLTTFQFAASAVLIIGALVAQFQLDYVQNMRLGFDKEHVVTFTSSHLGEQYPAFKQAAEEHAAIESVTSGPPMGIGHVNFRTSIGSVEGKKPDEITWLSVLTVDYDYAETMGLHLVAGRSFSLERSDAGRTVLLSEAATRVLGIADNPIGKTIEINGLSEEEPPTVIGVVEDAHNVSLHNPVEPLAFALQSEGYWAGLARLAPGRTEAGLEALKATWNQFLPERPFAFEFLDDRIEAQYQAEQRLARIFGLFSVLAVFVACLGLFGLVAFTAEQRTKEIGIRKVLGAGVASIVALLSKDFLKLVGIAFIMAAPIAYFAMQRWLEDFAYRIDLGLGLFILAGALALLVALGTVSYQAIKAATADPVKSLRYE